MPVVKSTTDRLSAAADPLASPLAASLSQHGMAAAALLYVTAHRPLAFAAGHLLAVAAPVGAVLGAPSLMDWAQLLTSPEGGDRLIATLAAAEAPAPAAESEGVDRLIATLAAAEAPAPAGLGEQRA